MPTITEKLSPVLRATLILFCFGPAAFGQIAPDDLLKERVPTADFHLFYGANELQFGELRLPKSKGQHPVAVLVHGGCWSARIGNLDPRATSLDLLRPMAAALTEAGMATWNVEYRRVGNPGGGWPGTFHDLSQATDYLRVIAPKHGLDLKRVIVMGHSSGAQLAHWIAAAGEAAGSQCPLCKKSAGANGCCES